MLHTVNKSPFEKNSLTTCFRLAQQGSAILLYEDGIYGALKGTQFESAVIEALQSCKIYVLTPDLDARGMSADNVISGIQLADYTKFVDLVVENDKVQTWL